MQTNSFGFTASGQRIYDLAEGLKFKILTKEDIVGSEEKERLLEDFAEDVKDDGVSPEIINDVLRDKFGVGKKYEIDENGRGKYVDDNEPHDWEGYIRKPKEEVKPGVKEDFTEKVLMARIQKKLDDIDEKYPELFGVDKKIEDGIALKKEFEKEKEALMKEIENKDINEVVDGLIEFANEIIEDIEKTDDFVIDPTSKKYLDIKGKLTDYLFEILHKKLSGE